MNIWKNKVIFITGANGFLGPHLAKRALRLKAKVIALVKDGPRFSLLDIDGLNRKCKIYRGNLTNRRLINTIFKNNKIDICFHLAAQAIVGVANQSPLETFKVNIEGTWNVLEAARVFGVKALIVASTDKAYGAHKQLPYEASPLIALHPYYASKFCADILSRTYAHTYNLPVAVTRCANVYGPGDFNFSRIVPDTIRAILQNKSPVIKSNGASLKDYAFVEDIVDAYFILAKSLLYKKISFGEAFNFGTGQPVSVLKLVKMIIQASGKRELAPKVLGKGKKRGEIDQQYLSSAKARRILDWHPQYTLSEGLNITYQWYRDYAFAARKNRFKGGSASTVTNHGF